MVDLNVVYIAQQYDFDCWYAALRMLVKFRVGPTAEPIGFEIAETEGMTQQSLRDNFRRQAVAQGLNPRAGAVQYPPRGLNANEFVPFARRNGLVSPMLPPFYEDQTKTGGWTLPVLETLLRMHGPL